MIVFLTCLSYIVQAADECALVCNENQIEQLNKSAESLQKENEQLKLVIES